MDREQVLNGLSVIVDALADQIPSERVDFLRELLWANESRVAVEQICSDIDDFALSPAPEIVRAINVFGNEVGVESSWLAPLQENNSLT